MAYSQVSGKLKQQINYAGINKYMKDTHLYQRLNNLNAVKTFMNMIKTGEKQIADELFANLTKDANDHPKYDNIKAAYVERFGSV